MILVRSRSQRKQQQQQNLTNHFPVLSIATTTTLESPEALQEFPVITSVFGNPVPPVQSISLAIDSNWGHDYACLYRVRVHGAEVYDDEDDGNDDDDDSLGR